MPRGRVVWAVALSIAGLLALHGDAWLAKLVVTFAAALALQNEAWKGILTDVKRAEAVA